MWGRAHSVAQPIEGERWAESAAYLRGIVLFNRGYYWEAHEAWESLWHAHGRRGAVATILRALIKLAAAGVKVREGRPGGVRTHAARAAALFEGVREHLGRYYLGLDLDECVAHARAISNDPHLDPGEAEAAASCVFAFELVPKERPCSESSTSSGQHG
jgi:hypothetical protein